nr:Uncharacterised protein [Klebsiella pneumoniae]
MPAKDCRHSAGNAVSRPRSSSLRRVPALSRYPYHLFESIRRVETSTTRLAVQGTAGPFAINFPGHSAAASLGRKNFPLTGHLHRAVLVYALAANGSQTGEGYIRGQVQQVPAQSQNRGPGNSTGDGFKRQNNRLRRFIMATRGVNKVILVGYLGQDRSSLSAFRWRSG